MANKKNEEDEERDKPRATPEAKRDSNRTAAGASIMYLLLALGFFGWLLFDVWVRRHSLPRLLGYDPALLDAPAYRLVAYTVIGGAIGSIVNGMRSCLLYFKGFDRHYVWKYIAAPWMGGTLALFVYALIRSSVAVFGGSMSPDSGVATPQALSNFAVGALAGYGSKDVFIWLDAQVHKIFQVTEETPDVKGKTENAALSHIQSKKLELGDVTHVPHKDGKHAGKVIDQSPAPETPIDRGEAVDIVVAAEKKNKK